MRYYPVERTPKYDFQKQSYSTKYPNLHRYPATMIPQLGIELLKEFGVSSGGMLDPYCGSGSSFMCGLECGLEEMAGYDINPMAVLISKAKFTRIDAGELDNAFKELRHSIYETLKQDNELPIPDITNINFWFSGAVIRNLSIIKHCVSNLPNQDIQTLFYVPFSETVRECSYTKNNEFKLVRMKSEDILNFNPDVIGFYLKKLAECIYAYKVFYLPKLKGNQTVKICCEPFYSDRETYDIVLTSPPYGDSRTTVAYGQFSTLANEWLDIKTARKIDSLLMGGKADKTPVNTGLIAEPIADIEKIDKKRALEVSAFYTDLEKSIHNVAKSIKPKGKAIYIVGNRTVKNVPLPTDQFIAEQFEKNDFRHLITYERKISNKTMPSRNSPTNETGKTVNTMLYEYIVVCEKAG